MADKQFIKGAITGVLCASLALGGGYVGLQKAGRAGSTVLSDVAVPQKIKYLEDIIDQNYLDEVDEDSLKEGLYTGLLALEIPIPGITQGKNMRRKCAIRKALTPESA